MVNCEKIREMLSALIDNELTGDETVMVKEHLGSCMECENAYKEMLQTVGNIQNLDNIEPPPWMTGKIMQRIREESVRRKGFWGWMFSPWHIKFPIEAFGVVLLALSILFIVKYMEPVVKDEVREEVELAPSGNRPMLSERLPEQPAPVKEGLDNEIVAGRSVEMKELRSDTSEKEGEMQAAISPVTEKIEETGRVMPDEIAVAGRHEASEVDVQADMPVERYQMPGSENEVSSVDKDVGPEGGGGLSAKRQMSIPAASLDESQHINISVHVKDIVSASEQIEGMIHELGGALIRRDLKTDEASIDLRLPGSRLGGMMGQLKKIGKVEGYMYPDGNSEDIVVLRIELIKEK
ncbi:MAG: DUF2275 domain-containing protein [Nitrospirota bacterium]|nr:MAG: DUF2275 domain-containing protein [Nitrospirota bacterium]